MRTPFGIIIILAIIFLVDLYLFFVIRSLSHDASSRTRALIYAGFWTISVLTIAGLLLFAYTSRDFMHQNFRTYLFAILVGLFFSKIIALVFFLIDDIRRIFQWIGTKLFFSSHSTTGSNEVNISRSVFLSWLGMAVGTTAFGTWLYGFSNKYNYRIKRKKLHFDNLPAAFRGMKIVFISDIHAGSFTNKEQVNHGVDMILNEKPDIIMFGGDLVNDMALEMDDYKDVFSRLKAPMGVFSVFGNHDYGEYVRWPNHGITKAQNLLNLEKVHAEMGWTLLRNRHVIIEKDGDRIPIIGVENWSNHKRFPKYGDLYKAHAGTENFPFKILISHDPSHWDAQIRPEFPDIDLTLSGHTHGMQFGVDIPGFKWSPVQYIYKQWDGLYENGSQKLYVNPGFGFIGYPGRVGILPEITVLEFS